MNPAIRWTTLLNPGTLTSNEFQHVHGTARYHAGCEHDLLDNRERGNLIQQDACVEQIRR